ncbi:MULTISPECIES: glycoside hydrolase family 43 protein [Paenibacillus]|uniref:glycoside hydrolase family 43 protein n=1 Tax=Paenibacillus TaxID=44249 RepID=UPI0022B91470|nr:glycoside hydrolase family 43 protein [Paenibacillus caseinilyticus]MCZ8518956.1 glycoside hydrolase family 43 protein [Paenibacillus caseinilyticus]
MSIFNEASDAAQPKPGLRLSDIPAHDPFVVADEESGMYYLYTSGGPQIHGMERYGVVTYRSADLRHWEGPYVVFTVPDGIWANPQHGTWAPEVHAYKGRYYLFVTLHNNDRKLEDSPLIPMPNHWRGTAVAVSSSLEGPFELLQSEGPTVPSSLMTLDGTLYIDETDGSPWMVYCHEWIQVRDGTVEAVPLEEDLSRAAGEPVHLFSASEAPWDTAEQTPGVEGSIYVTDGCQLYRTRDGHLVMLWSSYDQGQYVQTQARSVSGRLEGPWEQLEPLVRGDSGHGMLFRTFEGAPMLILHQPFQMPDSRCKLYDMKDTGDRFRVVTAREDLHGPVEDAR